MKFSIFVVAFAYDVIERQEKKEGKQLLMQERYTKRCRLHIFLQTSEKT